MASPLERLFQNDIIASLKANGWKVRRPERHDAKRALYLEDALAFYTSAHPAA